MRLSRISYYGLGNISDIYKKRHPAYVVCKQGVLLYAVSDAYEVYFKDLMTFGLFLLALLTFVFTFCK